MFVVLPTHQGDFDRAMELADWFAEVPSDYSKHNALVVGAATLEFSEIFQLSEKLRIAGFKNVTAIRAKAEESSSWPEAPNAMWRLAAMWMKDNGLTPWLWIEPDCAAMVPGWLDRITAEYQAAHKPYMGVVYQHPFPHLNGVCVYPPNVMRYNRLAFNSEFFQRPFDTVRPDTILPFAHRSKLFWRALEDPATNTPLTFPDIDSLSIIPPEAVLVHACKDGSLIARLREVRNPGQPVEQKVSLGQRLVEGVRKIVGSYTGYVHAGNLGDVVYALPAIKADGGGDLIICPEQRRTALCSVPIDRKQFELFAPLLRAQPYLKNVTYEDKYPAGAYDLNHFRTHWINRTLKQKYGITTLRACQFFELGLLNKMDEEPWLSGVTPIQTGKIIVGRSPRYQAPNVGPEAFPWQHLVNKHKDEMIFVGLESEHDGFCRTFGAKISYYRVRDFLEMAAIIAGGRCYLGNQSFALSLAIGLGQNVLAEACPRSPDCRVQRDNYHDQLQGPLPEI